MAPLLFDGILYRPASGDDVFTELPPRGTFTAAATRKSSKNWTFPLQAGEVLVYDASGGSGTVRVWRQSGDPTPIVIREQDFLSGVPSTSFLYPIAKVRLPCERLATVEDFEALEVGDALLAPESTLASPQFRGKNVPRCHKGQFVFVKEVERSAGGVSVTLVGLASERDPTDFSGEFVWTSDLERLALAGTPTQPELALPLGASLVKVAWRDGLSDVDDTREGAWPGDLVVATRETDVGAGRATLGVEAGEPLLVTKVTSLSASKREYRVWGNGGAVNVTQDALARKGFKWWRGGILPTRYVLGTITPEALEAATLASVSEEVPRDLRERGGVPLTHVIAQGDRRFNRNDGEPWHGANAVSTLGFATGGGVFTKGARYKVLAFKANPKIATRKRDTLSATYRKQPILTFGQQGRYYFDDEDANAPDHDDFGALVEDDLGNLVFISAQRDLAAHFSADYSEVARPPDAFAWKYLAEGDLLLAPHLELPAAGRPNPQQVKVGDLTLTEGRFYAVSGRGADPGVDAHLEVKDDSLHGKAGVKSLHFGDARASRGVPWHGYVHSVIPRFAPIEHSFLATVKARTRSAEFRAVALKTLRQRMGEALPRWSRATLSWNAASNAWVAIGSWGSKGGFTDEEVIAAFGEAVGEEPALAAQAAGAAPTAPNRVVLTRDRAARLNPGEPMWVRAGARGVADAAAGEQVAFAELTKRNRLRYTTARGKESSVRASDAFDGEWFEVLPDVTTAAAPAPAADPRVPLSPRAFNALQGGMVVIGAVTSTKVGVTEGKEYVVKDVGQGTLEPFITVTVDDGSDRAFSRSEAIAYFLIGAKDAPPEGEDEEQGEEEMPPQKTKSPDPTPAAPAQTLAPAGPAVVEPQEAHEEREYREALVRDRPLAGPSFRHRERVLNAMTRLLGNPGGGGLYTPGLWTLAEYGPLYDLLRAGWLVRDGSTMLMGIAGVGKTTFIKHGTRLMCGAPPRLTSADKVEAVMARFEAAKAMGDRDAIRAARAELRALRVGTLRVSGRPVPATDRAFDKLVADEAKARRRAWMVPVDPDAALRIQRLRHIGKKPPMPDEDPTLWTLGRSEHVVAAWAIHDAVNAAALLPRNARPAERERARQVAASVSEADAAWYREVFGSYFDYFATTFIGEAKSDPEKQPDEVLYKTKVLNVRYKDVSALGAITDTFGVPEGEATETVIFPEAQPIVLAPVKFVNESNRVSRALGDAFLGLLAEKEIEYRGKKFESPASLWWFDMNPHLGWGTLDWAFLDRIDVSAIVPAIGLNEKVAYEDTLLGRRREQKARFLYDTPEFNLDELQEIWADVERVDVGDYWPDDAMSDLQEVGLALPTSEEKQRGEPSPTYDPIYSLRLSAAMLEYFIATPDGFDFSRFVSHPNKAADPHDPRSGGGEHWEDLYAMMLGRQNLSRDDISSLALYAKLQRPFGFRAQASLRKFAKAFAWLRGSRKVELDDVLAVLPFVLNHRPTLNYDESNMRQFFSVYDWLTRKPTDGAGDATAFGQLENLKDRLTLWTPALAKLYKLQALHALMTAPEDAALIKPSDYEKVIDLAKKWVGETGDSDDTLLGAAASGGGSDGVLRAVAREGQNLLKQIEQEKDAAEGRTIPERVAARKYTRKDLHDWTERLSSFLRGSNARREQAIRDALAEAERYLTLELSFAGGGAVGFFTANDLDLDDETLYRGILTTLLNLVGDTDAKARLLPEWTLAEKRWSEAIAQGADPTRVGPVELALPKVGLLRIAFESGQPPHKTVRVEFDTATAAKKARTALRKDLGLAFVET